MVGTWAKSPHWKARSLLRQHSTYVFLFSAVKFLDVCCCVRCVDVLCARTVVFICQLFGVLFCLWLVSMIWYIWYYAVTQAWLGIDMSVWGLSNGVGVGFVAFGVGSLGVMFVYILILFWCGFEICCSCIAVFCSVQGDVNGWDVSQVTTLKSTFSAATAFNVRFPVLCC